MAPLSVTLSVIWEWMTYLSIVTVHSFRLSRDSGRLCYSLSISQVKGILDSGTTSYLLNDSEKTPYSSLGRLPTTVSAHNDDFVDDGSYIPRRSPPYRGYVSRGGRRWAGRLLRQQQLSRPEDSPYFTDDFGGIPNLPHKYPIALSIEPFNEEFLEMRKRQIPHSMLKDYYMHRSESTQEVLGVEPPQKYLVRHSPRDKYVYLLGEGTLLPVRNYKEYDVESREPGPPSEDGEDVDPGEPWEDYEGVTPDERQFHEENVQKACNMLDSYDGKDAICQLLLTSIKEAQEGFLKPMTAEEPPYDQDIIIPELEDYFVTDSEGFPIWIIKWNKEYLSGREGLEAEQLEKYDKMWYERISWLHDRYRSLVNNDGLIERMHSHFKSFYHNIGLLPHSRLSKRGELQKLPWSSNIMKLRWSEYLPTYVLESFARYSLPRKGMKKDDTDIELRAELFRVCIHMSKTRLLRERALKEEEKTRLEYIDFLHKRRHALRKRERIGPQANTPFWLWQECWKRRDTLIPDTLLEIMKGIRAVDPKADLKKLLSGTLENIKSPKIQGTTFDIQMLLDNDLPSKMKPVEDYIEEKSDFSDDNNTTVAESPLSIGGSKAGVVNDETSDGDSSPLPKPLGYFFKDVLSFEEFEKAFKQFNIECFGKEEYGVRVGQLVKGTVQVVRRKHMLIDIHTSKFATITLSDHFQSSKEVPPGGFNVLFRPGDELYFEVISKYGNNIRLSTRRIQRMHKSRDIYRKYFKREITKVRVLQRYTNGVLVQYQGDDAESVSNYQCPPDVGSLENLAFVPYGELHRQYRSIVHRIRRDIVGKVIPVYMSEFIVCNGIPLVSNVEAIRRLLLLHVKPGDVIKALPCMYGKDVLWLHVGHTIGILPTTAMSKEDYEKHKKGDNGYRTAVVESVDYLAGTMLLSSKILEGSRVDKPINECLHKLKDDSNAIDAYNTLIKETTPVSSEKYQWEKIDPDVNTLHNIHNVPKMKLTYYSTPHLPVTLARKGERTFEGIRWDVDSPDFPDKISTDENDAYHNYRWEVLTESGWVELSPAEMRVLNRAKYQNDEVVYYQHDKRNYRIDLLEMVRQNLTDLIDQPLRNNCFRVDNDYAKHIGALNDMDMNLNAF